MDHPLTATATAALLGLAVVVIIVRRSLTSDVRLLHTSNPRAASLLVRLPTLRRGYRPPPLVPGSLLQTALNGASAPAEAETPFQRETLRLPPFNRSDLTRRTACCPEHVPEGVVSIDWLPASASAPICLLVPGLTGSSSSGYIRCVAVALHRQCGVCVACYNPRGRGGNSLVSPFMYSAGYTEDLRRVLLHIRRRHPTATLVAAGFSFGSSYLAKYVGEEGVDCPLAGAMLFTCPCDLPACSTRISTSLGGSFLIRHHLLPSVVRMLREHRGLLAGNAALDLDGAERAQTMEQFDACAIAPMMGCKDVLQYYREASACRVLDDVRVPLLFLSAHNDPIAPADLLDRHQFSAAGGTTEAPLILATTAEGGHSQTWPQGWRACGAWSADVLVEFVRALAEDDDTVKGHR